MSVMTRIDKIRKTTNWVDIMPLATLIILVIIMTIGSPRFLMPSNLLGMLAQGSTLLVMGLGQTFIILMGSIDLSIAPVAQTPVGNSWSKPRCIVSAITIVEPSIGLTAP